MQATLFFLVIAHVIHFDWNNIDETSLGLLGSEEPEWYFRSKQGEAWRFAVAPDQGQGSLEYFRFSDAINVLSMDCQFNKPRDCIVEDGENLRFNFCSHA
ncbi:MAG: hypothetical protein Pars2KO_17050 [Parasphingorhabdus sp.]